MTAEHRVYGPPGCGKTTYLSRQAKRAAEQYGPKQVIVASLTRTAAQEVAGRDTGIPTKNVSTLHAHAFRALDHPEVADVPEGFAAWNAFIGAGPLQIRTDASIDLDAPPAESLGYASDGEILLAEYGMARNRMLPRELWSRRVREFAERWEEWKRKSGRMDFVDMIERALETVPQLPGEPSVLMLDEAQDLSKLEMALARSWGEKTEHFVIVGDPDQNLYEWRGSDPAAFTAVEAASEHVLSQSYRVPRAVHRYAVRWIEKIEKRKKVEYMARDEEGSVELVRSSWSRPDTIVKQALEETEKGRSVMILASCAFMLEPAVRVLRAEGIPFHNPYRVKQGAWNPMRSAYRVRSFLRPDPRAWPGEEPRFWSWSELRAWMDPLIAQGVMVRGAKSLVEAKCVEDRFGASDGDVVPKLEESFGLFNEEHHDALLDLDLDWWESKLRAKRKQTYAYPLAVARRRGYGALSEEPKIVVGTIHSVKGGEADVVYVFPDISRRAADELEARRIGAREAAIRMFYVAFTRARETLRVCRPDAQWYLRLPEP